MSETIYGIDLGTSNCLAAKATTILGQVKIDCLMDDEGNISFPSVVYIQDKTRIIVGEKARDLMSEYPDQTIELVKVRMGKEKEINISLLEGKLQLSPQEISGLLLRHFNYLHSNKVKKAVLTVPAYFDDNQKNATLQAGELAGIEIIELIEEPSAAIMYHLYDTYGDENLRKVFGQRPNNFLVFDFGGGTLDLSLIEIELDQQGYIKPTVLLKGGSPELGGNDIDFYFTKLLLEYLAEEYEDDFSESLLEEFEYYQKHRHFRVGIDDEMKVFILRLKNTVESAKIRLSSKDEVTVEFDHIDYDSVEVEREYFQEEVLEEYFKFGVQQALDDLKVRNKDNHRIDQVIMVGGTSQIPYFKELIEATYPELKNKIIISRDYDNAIAKGAAILGAIHSGLEVPPFGSNRCYGAVSYDIFIEHKDHKELLVENGTQIPLTEPKVVSFPVKHALETSIRIQLKEKITQYDLVNKSISTVDKLIKDVKFYHPFFYTGEKVAVSLEIDEYGLLNCSAIHTVTKEKIDFQAEKLYQLTPQELERARTELKRLKE